MNDGHGNINNFRKLKEVQKLIILGCIKKSESGDTDNSIYWMAEALEYIDVFTKENRGEK